MKDLFLTLAMNSLFIIREMILIWIYDFGFTNECKLVLCHGLNENIVHAWDFLHKMGDLTALR